MAQDPCAIQTKFGTPSNLLFGPFEGRLENDGEKVELRSAEGVRIDEVDYRRRFSWVIVDEVIYDDYSPWPETPDGTGDALQRINSDQYHSGNDPENWEADIPSPGEPN